MEPSRLTRNNLRLLYAAFVLSGIGTTILGPILPVLSSHWKMNDAHAGSLFTAQFLGSALGGLVAGIHPTRSAIAGFLLAASGLLSLTIVHPPIVLPVIFLYGFGVGLVLTGINLIVSRLAGEMRSSALSWLNFCWSLGATICPLMAAVFVAKDDISAFILAIALSFTVSAIVIVLHSKQYREETPPAAVEPGSAGVSIRFLIAYFSLLLFLYVGVETTLGGWLSTLASRSHSASTLGAYAISASSFFWLALLVGRGTTPFLLKMVPETVLQPAAVGASVVAMALLLRVESFAGISIAGGLAGFFLAPVFPLTLSFFLARAGQTRSVGLVFAICGTGGAALPWITGIVSTYRHSLRWGLSVPLLAAVAMLLFSLNYVVLLQRRGLPAKG